MSRPFGRLEVDRDDQDCKPTRRQEIADERRRFDEIVRGHLDEMALDGLQGGLPPGGIDAGEGDDPAWLFPVAAGTRRGQPLQESGGGGGEVDLVDDPQGPGSSAFGPRRGPPPRSRSKHPPR